MYFYSTINYFINLNFIIRVCVEPTLPEPSGDENLENTDYQEFKEDLEEVKSTVPQGEILPGDIISFDTNKIEVQPNPTTNDWTVKIITDKEENVKIQLSDMTGRVVYTDNKSLTSGSNTFVVKANNLAQGSYILQIVGNTIQFSNKLLKE